MMQRKSQRIRVPRSEAALRLAISGAVVFPSPIAVNISNSIADFSASVRWCALMVWKKSCGDGCWVAGLDIMIPLFWLGDRKLVIRVAHSIRVGEGEHGQSALALRIKRYAERLAILIAFVRDEIIVFLSREFSYFSLS